jgi:hypothetical protein
MQALAVFEVVVEQGCDPPGAGNDAMAAAAIAGPVEV